VCLNVLNLAKNVNSSVANDKNDRLCMNVMIVSTYWGDA
jgi:hypothetical protein